MYFRVRWVAQGTIRYRKAASGQDGENQQWRDSQDRPCLVSLVHWSTGAGGAATLDRCEGACQMCAWVRERLVAEPSTCTGGCAPTVSTGDVAARNSGGSRGRLPQHRMRDLSQLTHDAWINPFASAAHRRLTDGELESGSRR